MKSFPQRFKTGLTPVWVQLPEEKVQTREGWTMNSESNQVTASSRCWKPMKNRLGRSNCSDYHQAVQFRRKTHQKSCATVKDMAWRMSNPTAMSFHHLKKFPGYLKKTMDHCLVVEFPQAGEGCVKKGESYWCLETFSDSGWSGNKSHRNQLQEQ